MGTQPFDWKARHRDKIYGPTEAVRALGSGMRVLVGSGAAEPETLLDAMVDDSLGLRDVEVVHLLTLGKAPYVASGMEERFRHLAFFIGANVRAAVHEGRADFVPVFLSDIPRLIRQRRVRIDAALIQVSPPDRHGFVSLGVSVDIVRAAVDSAEIVLAEVNPRMPRTWGDSFLSVDRITALVAVDRPLPELPGARQDDVSRAIGAQLASLIPDGATLQVGIGAIPDAALAALSNHHDLGIHTEMLSDGVRALVEAGVITGRRKRFMPEKLVTSFVLGSRALYDWAGDNPQLLLLPSDFTNDPNIISRNDDMTAINSALAVDLTGQVASDTIGGRFHSGIGGQVDFIRGASRSRGGRPIIALRSTAAHGKVSRIQARFEEGAGVVTSRGDVHTVVTEYGVAELWGKSVRERALALLSIAHPDFRAELLAAAKNRRFVLPGQRLPRAVYPWRESRLEKLAGGEAVRIRPIQLSDQRPLQDFLYGLSDESAYRRFLLHVRDHPREELEALVDLDYQDAMGLVAVEPEVEAVLGVVRWDVDVGTRLAEIAFVVRDDWQGKGLGTRLMRRAVAIARAQGLKGFTADVLVTNTPALALFSEAGLHVTVERDLEVLHLVARFDVSRGASKTT